MSVSIGKWGSFAYNIFQSGKLDESSSYETLECSETRYEEESFWRILTGAFPEIADIPCNFTLWTFCNRVGHLPLGNVGMENGNERHRRAFRNC